jgi:amino-acid N-acetyltransferase
MNSREASKEDLLDIGRLLCSSNLPSQDIVEHIDNFVVIEENEIIIGVGGLEISGRVGLVRSIVVAPEHRGNGIGKKIYKLLEIKANDLGINTLYLLTESAAEYFLKLGFVIKDRADVPLSVMETKQFKELCPPSAKVMFREI